MNGMDENDFMCPIGGEIMTDPVIARDGHTYERKHITEWFRVRLSSPLTNEVLPSAELMPNHTLKKVIDDFLARKSQPLCLPKTCTTQQLLDERDIPDEELNQIRDHVYDKLATSPEVPSTKKKKKKKEDERDAQGRRTLLNDCEVRGEAAVGEKLTAFAKRVKKVPIGCTFQWYRVDPASGRESKILGQDRASYVVKEEDCGYVLKVTSSPTVKETGEEGQPVSASTDGPVSPGHASSHFPAAQEGDAYGAMTSAAPPAAAEAPPAQSEEGSEPCLTDWKIEMNPDQEYTDPIKIHYQ